MPAAESAPATTQPSPPLLPGPAYTATPRRRRRGKRRAISVAAAAPERCITARDGMPASIERRSAAADCAAVTTRALTTAGELLVRLAERPTDRDLAVVDSEVEATLRVVADPGLVGDRRAVAPIIAQRKERSFTLALPAQRQLS